MLNRRHFLQLMAAGAIIGPRVALAEATSTNSTGAPALSGMLAAATILPFPKEGEPNAAVGLIDLKTGQTRQIKLRMALPHDLLVINREQFLMLPNGGGNTAQLVDASGETQPIPILEQMRYTGHAFLDKAHGMIYASASDYDDDRAGYFICIDPSFFKVVDKVPNKSRQPHDIIAIDDDTLAVCNYNMHMADQPATRLATTPRDGWSYLSFYRRKDLSLIAHQRAYKNAYVSHVAQSNSGDIYGIGHYDYKYPEDAHQNYTLAQQRAKMRALLDEYVADAQPELAPQFDRIAEEFTLHRVEKSVSEIGFPLLPLKTAMHQPQAQPIVLNPFVHRRAQSICHVSATDTVVMSFPHTDSVCLIDSASGATFDMGIAQHGLKEIRGICEIKDTPYVMLVGCHYGFALIDTRSKKVVKRHPKTSVGRIIHLHHVT